MKLKVLTFLTILGLASSNLTSAFAADLPYEVPKIVSFTVSQKQIDVNTANAKLTFTLTVSHPVGIRSTKTSLWFKSKDSRISVSTTLTKQNAASGSKEFKFVGDLSLDPSFPPGLYDFYAEPIEGEPGGRDLLIPKTSNLYPEPFNTFLGGESSVAVRSAGKLNLSTKTFVGPSHISQNFINDNYPTVYGSEIPIFRVDEIYDPNKYFIMRVKGLVLQIETTTPEVCVESDNTLRFVGVGNCSYRVFTASNQDYLETSIGLNAQIKGPRTKPILSMPSVNKLSVTELPITIQTYWVFSSSGDVKVSTRTPDVCFGNALSIQVIAGGKCSLEIQSAATNDYLASDLYQLTFDVTKDSQTITFKPVTSADVSAKTLDLAATASSGGAITYSSNSKEICTVEGSKLTLLKAGNCEITATQAGTSLIASVSAAATIQVTGKVVKTRTITCVKGKKSQKITGVKPKCPKGFKRR